MSLMLTQFPPDRDGRQLTVALATTDAELLAVQRLRRRIYVDEMGIIAPDHTFVRGDRLVDPYDGWSSQLMLRCDDRLIGTIRITEAADGPLELQEYSEVLPYLPVGARPAEATRYMVERSWRRTKAGPLLLYGAFRLLSRGTTSHMVMATKLGKLSTYYRQAGVKVLDAPHFEYGLTGCTYRLGALHVGAPGSLRRLASRAAYGSLKQAAGHVESVPHLLFRRRLRADTGRAAVIHPTHAPS